MEHSLTALVAGAALFAAASTGAYAVPTTFNVSTTINASCSVTDSGPANLTPSYVPSTDTSTGAATTLNTFCNGANPNVTFTDALNSSDTLFAMTTVGGSFLYYQISNTATCTGVAGDNPVYEDTAIALTSGVSSFNICAAVITGGNLNTGAQAGTYSDTVTYTIAP